MNRGKMTSTQEMKKGYDKLGMHLGVSPFYICKHFTLNNLNPMIKTIERHLKKLHPNLLVRDIRVAGIGNRTLKVMYLIVRKDDTYQRCTITMEVGD